MSTSETGKPRQDARASVCRIDPGTAPVIDFLTAHPTPGARIDGRAAHHPGPHAGHTSNPLARRGYRRRPLD